MSEWDLNKAPSVAQDWAKGVAAIISFLVFIGSWIYCIANYGFLFGFGLGIIPSAILSAIVWAIIKYMWQLVLVLLLIAVALIVLIVARDI